MRTENNIKLVLLPSREEGNSLHNTECGSAAVVLITLSIRPEPQVLAALRKAHGVPHVCRSDECTRLQN